MPLGRPGVAPYGVVSRTQRVKRDEAVEPASNDASFHQNPSKKYYANTAFHGIITGTYRLEGYSISSKRERTRNTDKKVKRMTIDETINNTIDDNPGLLSRAWKRTKKSVSDIKDGFSTGYSRLKYATLAAAVLTTLATTANAAPINPLDDVNSDSPTATVLFPSGYGNGTGAGAVFPHDMNSNTWAASTDDGWLLEYDGATFQTAIDTGHSGLTGVDYLGPNSLVVSAGTSLYFGHLDGANWVDDSSLDLTLASDITDVANGYGLADLFIPTASNGVYAIRGGALAEQIDTANVQAYDVIKLDPALYTHDMGQGDGEGYTLLDGDGVPLNQIGSSKLIELDNAMAIKGVAQINDGMYGVMNPGFQKWSNQDYASGIVPEPATGATIVLGGAALALFNGKKKQQIEIVHES